MTAATTAAELAHALLGDRESAGEWAEVTREVAGEGPSFSINRAFRAFTAARADARLRADPDLMRAALAAFDQLDARFEWAVTALVMGGDTARQGRAVLADLGTALPS